MLGALPQFSRRVRSSSGLYPVMSQVNCTGNEDDFMDCIASSSETCSNGQFAGVDCLGNNNDI